MSKSVTKLKQLREDRFLTQHELADAANVTIRIISHAENGGKISLGSIKKIAGALGVKPEKLL